MNPEYDWREALCRQRRKNRPARICYVLILAGFLAAAVYRGYEWKQQQGVVEFIITSPQPLTREIAEQIAGMPGVEAFSPVLQTEALIKINQYKTSVMLTGADLSVYPVKYEAWVRQVENGSRPVIFLGQGCFSGLQDQNGNRIPDYEMQQLISDCKRSLGNGNGQESDFTFGVSVGEQTLDVITAGILSSPENEVVMSYEDLRALMSQKNMDTSVFQVWIQVSGLENAVSIRDVLETAGMTFDRALEEKV